MMSHQEKTSKIPDNVVDFDAICALALFELKHIPKNQLVIRGKISRYLLRKIEVPDDFKDFLLNEFLVDVDKFPEKVLSLIYLLTIISFGLFESDDVRGEIKRIGKFLFPNSDLGTFYLPDVVPLFVERRWPDEAELTKREITRLSSVIIREFVWDEIPTLDEIFRSLSFKNSVAGIILHNLYKNILIEEELQTLFPGEIAAVSGSYL